MGGHNQSAMQLAYCCLLLVICQMWACCFVLSAHVSLSSPACRYPSWEYCGTSRRRFLCLEFSRVTNPALASAYDTYSFAVIPRLGGLVAGDAASYQYLVESIRQFPDQASVLAYPCGL